MRKSEFSQGSRRLTSVKESQNARKSLATANFSTRKSDFGSGVRQSLLGRNSFCPSTTKTGRKGGYKDPRELQGLLKFITFRLKIIILTYQVLWNILF